MLPPPPPRLHFRRVRLLLFSSSITCVKHSFFSLLSAFVFLLVQGCSRSGDSDSRQVGPPVKDEPVAIEEKGELDPIASPDAVKGGTFYTWGGEFPKSLNYWLDVNSFSNQICGLLFQPLVSMHPTKEEPVGILAESWEVSPDKKTYTFKINPKAVWSDGKPVTAEDVQFYYDVIMDPKNLTSIFRVDMSRFARPEIVDEKTVRLTATEAHWKNFWTAADFLAFPKHVWQGKDFNQINFEFPVVNGPYKIFEVNTNRSIILQRRPDWWGLSQRLNQHKYNFDYLVYRSMEDQNKVLETLKRGDIDLYPVYTARIWAQQTDFDQIRKNWIVKQEVYNQEPKAFQGFSINLRKPLFQDPKVREALAHLLNRELMLDKLMFNQYFLLNSYYPDLYPNNINPGAPLLKYDPEKARKLLGEAGWKINSSGILTKDGKPFELVMLHHGEDLPHLTIFLEDLKAVGIQARIDKVSQATHTKRIDDHDFDLVWRNWSASRLRDPETQWSSKTAKDKATQNISGVMDPEIDRLIESQKLEMDLAKRNDILRKIDGRLTEIKPYILLWQSEKSRLLYWNRFGTPKSVLDKFNREDAAIPYWWYDAKKASLLQEAIKANQALPAQPAKVYYSE